MAEHDYDIANATAITLRGDINNVLAAIVSQNSKATEPSTTFAFMWWYDTTNDELKMRNKDNDAWIIIGTFNQSTDTFTPSLDQDLTDIAAISGVEGDIIKRGSTAWERLAIGTAGQVLKVNSGATALEYGTGGGWEEVGIVEPTSDAASIELTGIGAFRTIRGFAVFEASAAALISLQGRVAAGTWRTIAAGGINTAVDGAHFCTFEISDFDGSVGSNVKIGKMIEGRITSSPTLDRSNHTDTGSASNVYQGYSTHTEAWTEVRLLLASGNFKGVTADERAYMLVEGHP